MVYYIRFAKLPFVQKRRPKAVSRALITISTDLGDSLYPDAASIFVTSCPSSRTSSHKRQPAHKAWSCFQWRGAVAGMRVLWIDVELDSTCVDQLMIVMAYPIPNLKLPLLDTRGDVLSEGLQILGIRAPIMGINEQHAGDMLAQRQLWFKDISVADDRHNPGSHASISHTSYMTIWEETGESIARHVWDAGIMMLYYLHRLNMNPRPGVNNIGEQTLWSILHTDKLRIVELGSGCGVVGLWIARNLRPETVLLTDLPEALEILRLNAGTEESGASIAIAALEWGAAEVPSAVENLKQRGLHLIILSDCTYNADSVSSLISTIDRLASKQTLILISTKRRHDSEVAFFELLEARGFKMIHQVSLSMGACENMEEETVEIFVYRGS